MALVHKKKPHLPTEIGENCSLDTRFKEMVAEIQDDLHTDDTTEDQSANNKFFDLARTKSMRSHSTSRITTSDGRLSPNSIDLRDTQPKSRDNAVGSLDTRERD